MAGCQIRAKHAVNGIVNGTSKPESTASTPPHSVITEKELTHFAEARASDASLHDSQLRASTAINGRVIKQLVRAAMALSLSERVRSTPSDVAFTPKLSTVQRPLAATHIDQVLRFQATFVKDFEDPSGDTMYEASDGTSAAQVQRRSLYY